MKLKIIACKVFWRELSLLTANAEHYCDITYLQQGLHVNPGRLREAIRNEIEAVESGDDLHTNYLQMGAKTGSVAAAGAVSAVDSAPNITTKTEVASESVFVNSDFDAILLCYALCAGGIEGLSAAKHTLVVPRAHDCITLLLGSRSRYEAYFFEHIGTYWSSIGWMDCCGLPDEAARAHQLAVYRAKYGNALADKLVKAGESWKRNYSRLAYIAWEGLDGEAYTERCLRCRACADGNGWAFERLLGDSGLLRRFISGDWDSADFLQVPPGGVITQSYDERIVICDAN